MIGLTFGRLAPRLDTDMIVLCFEDGETETVKGAEIMDAAAQYGGLYVQKVTPFAVTPMKKGAVARVGCEVQLSNQAEAGRK